MKTKTPLQITGTTWEISFPVSKKKNGFVFTDTKTRCEVYLDNLNVADKNLLEFDVDVIEYGDASPLQIERGVKKAMRKLLKMIVTKLEDEEEADNE